MNTKKQTSTNGVQALHLLPLTAYLFNKVCFRCLFLSSLFFGIVLFCGIFKTQFFMMENEYVSLQCPGVLVGALE